MLNLNLRNEFLGTHMPGTAISLRRKDQANAVEQDANQILKITYPTTDVQTALRAISASVLVRSTLHINNIFT